MLKKVVFFITCMMLMTAFIGILSVQISVADPTTISVHPGESIQAAINAANPGDTIFVKNGTYKENIIISKERLYLCGENKNTTIIDGNNISDAVNINADSVKISGFTITNGRGKPMEWFRAGIILSNNSTITENIISHNRLGIYCEQAINVTISYNTFIYDGINFGLPDDMEEIYYSHNIINNTVNGKPLYYYTNKHNFKVPENAGQIIAVNCTNMTIQDVNMDHTDFEVILVFCSKCLIKNSIFSSNDGELWLAQSHNNTITGNTVSSGLHGICIQQNSDDNILENNMLMSNTWAGISVLDYCKRNIIRYNTIEQTQTGGGIYIRNSNDNIATDNTLFKNYYGILIVNSSYNDLFRNNLTRNKMYGIFLRDNSNNNTIKNNNFRFNILLDAFLKNSFFNHFYQNYWNRPKLFPKVILGIKKTGLLFLPMISFDLKPLKLPYSLK
jgi:parallel beta-helix repeat protein